MKKIMFALLSACILLTQGCSLTEQEETEMKPFAEHRNESVTDGQTTWVCYECGHEGNEGKSCAICGEKPNGIVTADGNIEIVHPENPGTGYMWSYTVKPKHSLKMVSDGYRSDMSFDEQEDYTPLTGVGGMHAFCFRPVKDGKVTISFTLARSRDEIHSEYIYTYEIKNNIPTRVAGEINTWVCDCGHVNNRLEQVCYTCERAMPGLEDGWFCVKCGRCNTKDNAKCVNCGKGRSYEKDWVCTCGYAVLDGHMKSCERCDTIPPTYPKTWVCAICESINASKGRCEVCGESEQHNSNIWICECRHINNLSTPPEEWSDICTRCGKSRPAAGNK